MWLPGLTGGLLRILCDHFKICPAQAQPSEPRNKHKWLNTFTPGDHEGLQVASCAFNLFELLYNFGPFKKSGKLFLPQNLRKLLIGIGHFL